MLSCNQLFFLLLFCLKDRHSQDKHTKYYHFCRETIHYWYLKNSIYPQKNSNGVCLCRCLYPQYCM